MKLSIFVVAVITLSLVACKEQPKVATVAESPTAPDWKTHPMLSYEVIREFPHDSEAFTQGLLLSQGQWIESTGGFGTTSIRRLERETGKVLLKTDLPVEFFGEGAAEMDGKIYQLTWQNQQGFIYDAKSLRKLDDFRYQGEGWGLATDGISLIMSNGSNRLRFIDPKTFRVWRELPVSIRGKPVNFLNELEYIEGEIFANVWRTDKIIRINPKDGNVIGVIDLAGIDAKEIKRDPEHVLNGIAYDPKTREMFVTGKCWPKIYQIRLVPQK
jgi:glutaminyl-peptide cyclotransferase